MRLTADVAKHVPTFAVDPPNAVRQQWIKGSALKLVDPGRIHLPGRLPAEHIARNAGRVSYPSRPELRSGAVKVIIEWLNGVASVISEPAEPRIERRRLRG